jgi:hypothetical protein
MAFLPVYGIRYVGIPVIIRDKSGEAIRKEAHNRRKAGVYCIYPAKAKGENLSRRILKAVRKFPSLLWLTMTHKSGVN